MCERLVHTSGRAADGFQGDRDRSRDNCQDTAVRDYFKGVRSRADSILKEERGLNGRAWWFSNIFSITCDGDRIVECNHFLDIVKSTIRTCEADA